MVVQAQKEKPLKSIHSPPSTNIKNKFKVHRFQKVIKIDEAKDKGKKTDAVAERDEKDETLTENENEVRHYTFFGICRQILNALNIFRLYM